MNHVIYGPPGAGKTTYALKHMSRGDVIIDFDLIFAALSGRPPHDKPANLLQFAWDVRDAVYRLAIQHKCKTWIVTGGAKRRDRDVLCNMFNAKAILVTATLNECYSRIRDDPTRPGKWQDSKQLVDKWFKLHEKE